MRTILSAFLLFLCQYVGAQTTISVPQGTVDIQSLINRIAALETKVNQLQPAPAAIPGTFDDLLLKNTAQPVKLRISDPFGKENVFYPIGADLALKLHVDSVRQNYGSFIIQNGSGSDLFRFRNDGSFRYSGFKFINWSNLTNGAGRYYFILVLDDAGNSQYIRVRGSFLRNLLYSSH